jgi:hypothetical protein
LVAIGWAYDRGGVEANCGAGKGSRRVYGLAIDDVSCEIGVGVWLPGEVD